MEFGQGRAMRRRLFVLAFLVCLILTGDFVFGATWVGNYPWGPLWNMSENWDPIGVPGPYEAVYINPPPEQGPVIDYDAEVGNIYGPRFDSDSNQAMYIFYGIVTVNGNWEFGDNGSGTSFVTIYGEPDVTVAGEIRQRQGRAEVTISDSASLNVGSSLILADSGFASLEISGEPTVVIGSDLGGGKNIGSWFESYISGGDVSVGGSFLIGTNGSGVIDISDGNVSCGYLRLDVFSGESAAELNISGGRVDVNDELSLCNGSGTAMMNVSGGELNVGDLVMADGDGNSIINMIGGTVVVEGELSVPESVDGNGVINLGDGLIVCGSFTHGGAYLLDVNDGVLIIDGDANSAILADVNDGYITAAVDKNSVMVDYNNINPGKTTVWAAPHFELVPDVVGFDRGAVQSVLSQSGFAIGIVVEEYNDVKAADEVMGQDPNAGDVLAMGSSVNLLISLGQPIVPDVRGMLLADANTAIEAVDQLTVGLVTYGYSDTVAAGDVISQLPMGGVRVPIGSSIDLVISLGMPIVPYVTGETEADAITGVEHVYSLSATVSYEYHNEVAAGFVSSQDPVGGTPVLISSVVSLVVSLGQPIVPDLTGMTQGEAAVALGPFLLVVGSVGFSYSDSIAGGLVMSQSPAGGTAVPIGSGINLSVSRGRPSVPDVVGLELSAATVAVEGIDNLVVGDAVLQYSDSVGSGVVISQNPVGGSLVLIGTGVELTVSLGPPVVVNVVGLSEGAAVGAIEAVDSLTSSVSYEYNNDVAVDNVISQNPVGGTSVSIGSVVNLVVSLGRPIVPDLAGMTEGEAAAALGPVLLVVGSVDFSYSDSVAADLVISQSPVSGTAVAIGSGVDLVVSLGRPEVPDVVGLELSPATVAVEGIDNLVVGDVVWQYSDSVSSGIVISQNPVGGSLVLIGTPVELTVSLGRPVVPDVVGQSEATGVSEIESIDSLTVSLSYEFHNDIAGGIVISQGPVGGAEVDIGTIVELVISLDRPVVVDVVGMLESDAIEAIEEIDNLSVSVGYAYDNVVAAGSVVSQVPVDGSSVEIGSEVGIVVSLGRPVVVDVVGSTESAAALAIETVDNLGTIVTYEYDNGIAAGVVISQLPVGGSVVDIGTVVTLVVSLGRPLVPLVIEMSESEAIGVIESVDNLQASVSYDYHDSIAAGSVIGQFPLAGTEVTIGTTVNVIVSLGRPVIPDVVGQSRTDAILAIRGVGRYYAEVHYAYHYSVLADIVISQDPVGGVDANVGTVVSLQVSAGGASEMVLGGYRLVELQNDDGGWDKPLSDGNPYTGSDPYDFTWAALGLSQAYLFSRQSDDPNLRAGLEKASSYLLSKEYTFTVGDGYLAVELDRIFGGSVHRDYVKLSFYDKLAAGTYADSRSGEFDLDTSEYVGTIRNFYSENFECLAAWELGVGVYSARVLGVDTSEWVGGLKEEIDELEGSDFYAVLGLTGAVLGLSSVDEDYDPVSGEHAGASSLEDLASILAAFQLSSGGFTWSKWYRVIGYDESIEETVFGLMALNEFDRVGYLDVIRDAEDYIQSVVLGSGGWENLSGNGEENRITGEAVMGLATTLAVIGDFDGDADVDMFDFAYLGLAWMSEPGDSNWNADCDISELHDLIINFEDLGAFLDNWLVRAK